MPSIKCIVVTPEKTVLETTASFVVVPLFDGELGISVNHAPMIGRLGYGELRIENDGQIARFYVDGGFVQVADNEVTLLTGKAIPAHAVDLAQAQQKLEEAIAKPSTTDEMDAVRNRLLQQARAQVHVAQKAR
ncbi:MAG: ATP synthase F1 subunit epsilon [Pirellulaceae bacterium]